VHAERGLARPRRAQQQRAGARGQPAAQHRVQLRHAGRQPAAGALVPRGALLEQRVDARVDDDAAVGDAEGVAAAQEGRAAELRHLEMAPRLRAAARVLQRDQPVHHGVGALVEEAAVVQHEGDAAGLHGVVLQLAQEAADRAVEAAAAGAPSGREQAVEDEQRRARPGQLGAEQPEQRGWPVLRQRVECADVVDPARDGGGVEEVEAGHVAEHAGGALRQQRDVERPAAARRKQAWLAKIVLPAPGAPRRM
jgi:hypothetical protein